MSDVNTASKTGTCRACNGVVSKAAKVCPHCGQKKPYKAKTNWKKILIYSGIGFGLWSFINIMAAIQSNPDYQRAPSPQDQNIETAIRKCEAAILGSVNNPSTVDIKRFTGFGQDETSDGTKRITQTFSAKNSFGLEQTYDAYCTLTRDGKFDIKIQEQGR